ncbi:MAG: glycoside hydrolase [Candidatus Eremiobacteraeota bacterium]|nr:glycoside hydrolase [Candidatus Eremiobacteraeota bacterium]
MKRFMPLRRFYALAVLAALTSSVLPLPARTQTVALSQYAGMQWRFIGPLRGGRTKAVAGVTNQPNRFYIGAVNGGIWRTDDAGRTWVPLFDNEPTGSIGALAVAQSNPDIIYAGSGEGEQRPDLSIGDGVYKSTDAGATWTHLGLRDGQQIPQIAVDPKNPNRLFVAVLGHPYGPNAERGVYRSLDGGATFKRVLYRDDNTGANDVQIDPSNPNVVYATLWSARSAPWEAGPFQHAGSGVFKSTDGGDTWTKLTNGLPPRIGRSELGIAPSDTNVVYAAVDAPTGCAIYRSDDAGQHFSLTSSDDRVCARAGDLLTVTVDPKDPHTVYATSTSLYRSTDGGKTFTPIKGAPGGDDYQGVWINPNDPGIIALTSDQGAEISVDHAKTWSSWYNQPTGQMYHVNADDHFPYWVCGGQQDSGSACVLSRGDWGQVNERDWHPAGAEEYGYVVPDPLHPGNFYGGKVEHFDERTSQTQEVSPNPLRVKPYRVVRTEPIAFDHFDKHVMYFGANQVYETRNGGMNWNTISPDLTRAKWAMPSVIEAFESDDSEKGAHRGVVYALAPSYTHAGTIWAGTDDGSVWITRDHGTHWKNITPPQLTAWSKISQIDASHFDDNTAYVAVNRFRLDDLHPWIYRTRDGGSHWSVITNGLPPDEPVNAVRQDPQVRGLLYAATEGNVYVSFDDGAHWQSLQNNLPHTSMRDIIVHGDDVIVATHGRGFWILDDVEPLRELARKGGFNGTHLFTPQLAYRVRRNTNTDTPLTPEEPHGQNPPEGAILDYTLNAPAQRVVITIRDGKGNVVRRYSSDDPEPPVMQFDKPSYWERPFQRPDASIGEHRFAWDLRETSPQSVTVDLPMTANEGETPRAPQGALVVPGRYTVELTVDGRSQSRPLILVMDPRIHTSAADLQRQYEMAHETAALMDSTYAALQNAKRANETKRATQFGTLNTRLTGLLDLIDGADAPVPEGTRRAFCTLHQQSISAGASSTGRNSLCP